MLHRHHRTAILSGGGPAAAPFNPSSLFAGGEDGDWWTVAEISTLAQNSAGTTPVTANGDLVGYILGMANSTALVQGTTARKGVYTVSGSGKYIVFDGIDDALGAAFTLSQPMTRVMAARQVTWTDGDRLWDGGAGSNSGGVFQFTSTPRIDTYAGSFGPNTSAMTIGASHVVTEIWNGASSKLAINNGSYATGNVGASNAGGLVVGATATNGVAASNIWWYGGINIGRVLTDAEIANCRTYFGALAGLSL